MNGNAFRTATTLVILMSIYTGAASAQDYTADWFTIDGGGAMLMSGGDFELSGAIGQPDAGVPMIGGQFELTGGFWAAEFVGPPVPGDIDGDGDVDLSDLANLLAAYGTCTGDPGYNPDADIDGSGCVDLADLAALLANYGYTP